MTERIIDLDGFKQFTGLHDDLEVAQFLLTFRHEFPTLLSQIAQAMINQDASALKKAAHAAKGNTQAIHAHRLTQCAIELHESVNEENWPNLQKIIPQLYWRFFDVALYIDEFLKTRQLYSLLDWSNYTFLLIDDAQTNQAIIRTTLRKVGNPTLLKATCSSKALALMEEINEKVDLIIAKMVAPNYDGLKTLKSLRKQQVDVPIVLSIKKSDPIHLCDSLAYDVNGFLSASLVPNKLLQRIHRCLDLHPLLKNSKTINEELFPTITKGVCSRDGHLILPENFRLTPQIAFGLYDLRDIGSDLVDLPKLPFGNMIDAAV
jgi:CheY-like chemotaxis protein/HPt (histidine-containing phosphotransfer) domain-containing protein